ncbi:MAG: hypothetical protein ACI9H6_000484 [Patiriisocius sp.]|jgi:hypothetical protein
MSQSLVINNKTYVPSAVIAREFDYTSDYVSRLAREEKIAATRVGRSWYISEESLRRFVADAEAEKAQRGEDLRMQRQAERMMRVQKEKSLPALQTNGVHLALAQSLAVVMCGVFLGFLGLTVSRENIGLAEVSSGVQGTFTQLAGALVPDQSPIPALAELPLLASLLTGGSQTAETLSATEEFSEAAVPVEMERTAQVPSHNFSDEVEVTYTEDGKGIVRPVFKDESIGDAHEVLVAPGSNSNTN